MATAVLFVVAGYDTISTTLSFVTHQLATHPKHQDRVRQELREIARRHNGFTYEALMEAKLLDAFIAGDAASFIGDHGVPLSLLLVTGS